MQSSFLKFDDRSPLKHLDFIWRVIGKDVGEEGRVLHDLMMGFYKALAPIVTSQELELCYEVRQENGGWVEYLSSKDDSSDSNYISIVCMHTDRRNTVSQGKQKKNEKARTLQHFNQEVGESDIFHPAYRDFVASAVNQMATSTTPDFGMGIIHHSDDVFVVSFSSYNSDSRIDFVLRPMQLVADEAIFNMHQLRRIGHPGGQDNRVCH